MFKKPLDSALREKHADARGFLFEMLRFKDDEIPGEGMIYCFTVEPGQRRGDHYHNRKQEWFSCVSGKVVVLAEDAEGKVQKFVLSAENPMVIYSSPPSAHAFYNEGDMTAVVVSYGSTQHDPEDPDTFPKHLEYDESVQ